MKTMIGQSRSNSHLSVMQIISWRIGVTWESGIYVDREYISDIEYKRKLLQPILRAARNHEDYKGRCRMDRDKLVILGRNYGLHNLTQLPDDLKTIQCHEQRN